MGVRKRLAAEKRKEDLKSTSIAKLVNVPTSPRKMRVVADLVRGKEVMQALNILKYNAKAPAARLEKLLQSAIVNWETKSGDKIDEGKVYVKLIQVDSARMLKRLRPAPQGRGYRVRKRSNHVTIVLDSVANKPQSAKAEPAATEEAK
ncbi:MAG: 50S ribosomal protein L22 [Bacteroidetes bacterium]|nr:50S ribosomal protein L22 [Bacteroidota bacterium]MBL0066518.1 50S ribosomal protein L22 [Bacteroidota bacterium]MBL0138828.1 50S ribosomal protein L22 [Bacteroidota bacterium]